MLWCKHHLDICLLGQTEWKHFQVPLLLGKWITGSNKAVHDFPNPGEDDSSFSWMSEMTSPLIFTPLFSSGVDKSPRRGSIYPADGLIQHPADSLLAALLSFLSTWQIMFDIVVEYLPHFLLDFCFINIKVDLMSRVTSLCVFCAASHPRSLWIYLLNALH